MTDQDELFELVQTSLKVMAKDIGERLKAFDERIAKLEQAVIELSSGSFTPSKSFETPKKEVEASPSPQVSPISTPSLSSTLTEDDKDDKKKKDLMDAIKIIDSL